MAPTVKQRKIAILGSRSVGKSSLTVQYCEGHFVESYYPTIENTFSHEIVHKGQTFATEIIDTAGQDEYTLLNSKHFIGLHGYLLVYSVSSPQSFDMITIIRDKILNHLGAETVPIVIVGNKSDVPEGKRKITAEQGQKLAKELHAGWTETSARNNTNVAKAFEMMIAEIEKSTEPDKPAGGGKCAVM
ncbi:GTP-binding protein rhb1 [Cyphellophora attinorum]|uniref:GTP-binding protein rhb1 n=1 Tax=Cyphellophora attinorum TaxID=1664694 RepID=A0A0N1HSB4_9EURO|nr:GTP-binding protein rhb1 [Phialophora attinorum]KPI41456.1 GTP-binding protein rhb1 [Phialophora attinorum]